MIQTINKCAKQINLPTGSGVGLYNSRANCSRNSFKSSTNFNSVEAQSDILDPTIKAIGNGEDEEEEEDNDDEGNIPDAVDLAI